MAIDKTDVHKLARLARLKLSDAEEAAAVQSLNAVLALIDDLREADTDSVDAMAYVQGRGLTLRCRDAAPVAGLPRETVLGNAPKSADGYFLVPKVIE